MPGLNRSLSLAFALVILAAAQDAQAQARVSTLRDTPAWEFAVQGGLWNLMRSSFVGGRVTRNFDGWIGAEVIADARRHATDTDPAYRLAGANLKFGRRLSTPAGVHYWVFLTAGVMASSGLGYGASPMVGVGFQTPWAGPFAFRVDVQRLVRGHTINNSGRVVMGAAIGVGR